MRRQRVQRTAASADAAPGTDDGAAISGKSTSAGTGLGMSVHGAQAGATPEP